jgi:hypothetical protein
METVITNNDVIYRFSFKGDDKNENISTIKNKVKVSDKDFRIIRMDEYELMKMNQYKVSQLKEICSYYNIKKTGNKDNLINNIYYFLKYSIYAVIIQKYARGLFLRRYIKSAGPGLKKRSICINESDFATLDPLIEIPFNQFYSFTDNNDNVYGFNIISLYELVCKKTSNCSLLKKALNPYNRKQIDDKIIHNFSRYLKLAKINKIEHVIVEKAEIIEPHQELRLKIIEVFQYINELGNYADSKWLTNLSRSRLILFIRELYDIWFYRSQLSISVMREIVPQGNPFIGINIHLLTHHNNNSPLYTDDMLMRNTIKLIEQLTKSSYTLENRCLGAVFVLTALTLVSEDARIALPWLFESVAHFTP